MDLFLSIYCLKIEVSSIRISKNAPWQNNAYHLQFGTSDQYNILLGYSRIDAMNVVSPSSISLQASMKQTPQFEIV